MPASTSNHCNMKRLRFLFACAALALLASVVWLVRVDHNRPWRGYQDEFSGLQASLAYIESFVTATPDHIAGAAVGEVLNAPLIDFAAPRGTPGHNEIKQVILPDVRRDLHFVESDTTDRCMTCHAAIGDVRFEREHLARVFERAIPAINGELERSGEPALTWPVVEDRTDLTAGQIAPAWRTLTTRQQEQFFDELLGQVNRFLASRGKHLLKFDQPLRVHPRSDLYVSADSPHPLNQMGCTVCHEGSGEETDFILAGHPSASSRGDGDRPMLAGRHVEAGCVRCHENVADVSMHDGEPLATRVSRGRHLFMSLGCVNCHQTKRLPDAPRVACDLTHVGQKLSRGFLQNWLLSPGAYRPSARMPHSLGQENNSDPLVTDVEVIAMVEYLLGVSGAYDPAMPTEGRWRGVSDEGGEAAREAADRGRQLFDELGCLGCHTVLAHRPSDADGAAGESIGEIWITDILAETALSEKAQAGGTLTDDDRDAIWEAACVEYEAMSHADHITFAMRHLPDEQDTLFAPRRGRNPVFTRFGPELSSVRAKFDSHQRAVMWLYDWLVDPRSYSRDTKMPRMRCKVDADQDEALALAVYLSTLNANGAFSTNPVDANGADRRQRVRLRDELIRMRAGNGAASLVRNRLVRRLAPVWGESPAQERIDAMDPDHRRWMFLGAEMIGHYGCYSCHRIPGFEETAGIGPELTNWGIKPVGELDFGRFDPLLRHDVSQERVYSVDRADLIGQSGSNPPVHVERTRASFAWHKLRNPRIWDRGRDKPRYAGLRMPNFFLTGEEADALTTFVLSRRPPGVRDPLRVETNSATAGPIAAGRNLAWERNCTGCHRIDGNAVPIEQFYWRFEGGKTSLDEANVPPELRGEGARVRGQWLIDYLDEVAPIRPWLRARMPGFELTEDESVRLAAYFAALGREVSQRLTRYADRVRSPVADEESSRWHLSEPLAGIADSLRRYALETGLVPANTLDPAQVEPQRFALAHDEIVERAAFHAMALDVEHPFAEDPPSAVSADLIADGDTLFQELNCLQCHVFGDPTVPGANAQPTAPDLQSADQRLRRGWIRKWLQGPRQIRPGTRMPNFFGDERRSAFADYPPADRSAIEARLRNKALIADGPMQIEALEAFVRDASAKRLNVTTTKPAK